MAGKWWNRLVSPASRAFFQEGRRIADYSLWDWVHGYFYARWPYLYIGIGTGEHPAARRFGPLVIRLANLLSRLLPHREPAADKPQITFADTYHGKVLPLKSATQLVTVKEDIRLPNLEKIIPYNLARDLILKNPDHIVALECPCRASRPDPCLPLDVCLIIGEPFAGLVLEHHASRARPITQKEAVEIIRQEDERGHSHHAFFKAAMLNRFYAICNCCACCCGAMQAQRSGTPMLASSGYLARVDEELCIGCAECGEFCQFGALSQADYHNIVDETACMGCGVCANHCAQGAISLVREPSKGAPLEICELMALQS